MMATKATQGNHATPATTNRPRLALFTMRNLNRHVSRCVRYEAEDVIASFYDGDLMAPQPSPIRQSTLLTRVLARAFRPNTLLTTDTLRITQGRDLFLMICNGPRDLRYADLILNLEQAKTTMCCFEEGWTPEGLSDGAVRLLRRFDVILTNLESNLTMLAEATQRPCYHRAWGIDALAFCPRAQPVRSIDVYSMGRRAADVHLQLLAMRANDPGFYYVHDTATNFEVEDPAEHRRLTIDTIRRSRYFVTYPGRFSDPHVTRGSDELSARFFEGAAAGAILIGRAPDCESFRTHFDWPDAVVPLDEPVAEVLARLDADLPRQCRIRRDNIINCLERHDWAYRWREILRLIDRPEPPAVGERIARLRHLANVMHAELP